MFKVITKFKDKNTKEIFEVESEYKSKSKNRLAELEEKGYIKKVEDKKPPKPAKSNPEKK